MPRATHRMSMCSIWRDTARFSLSAMRFTFVKTSGEM